MLALACAVPLGPFPLVPWSLAAAVIMAALSCLASSLVVDALAASPRADRAIGAFFLGTALTPAVVRVSAALGAQALAGVALVALVSALALGRRA